MAQAYFCLLTTKALSLSTLCSSNSVILLLKKKDYFSGRKLFLLSLHTGEKKNIYFSLLWFHNLAESKIKDIMQKFLRVPCNFTLYSVYELV